MLCIPSRKAESLFEFHLSIKERHVCNDKKERERDNEANTTTKTQEKNTHQCRAVNCLTNLHYISESSLTYSEVVLFIRNLTLKLNISCSFS